MSFLRRILQRGFDLLVRCLVTKGSSSNNVCGTSHVRLTSSGNEYCTRRPARVSVDPECLSEEKKCLEVFKAAESNETYVLPNRIIFWEIFNGFHSN